MRETNYWIRIIIEILDGTNNWGILKEESK